MGMCFPFAAKKAEEWFDQHFEARRGRAPKRHPDLNNMDKFKVVHGKVTDKWKKPPKPIVHAWVEMGDMVFDDQTKITKPDGIPKDVYYDMFQPEVVKEYNAEEVVVNCIMKGEGPWDDDLYAQMQARDAWMNEATEHDDHFKPLMDSGYEGIKQAIELADSLGIPSQELPWTHKLVDDYLYGGTAGLLNSTGDRKREWAKLLIDTGWTQEEYRAANQAEYDDYEKSLGLSEVWMKK